MTIVKKCDSPQGGVKVQTCDGYGRCKGVGRCYRWQYVREV